MFALAVVVSDLETISDWQVHNRPIALKDVNIPLRPNSVVLL